MLGLKLIHVGKKEDTYFGDQTSKVSVHADHSKKF